MISIPINKLLNSSLRICVEELFDNQNTPTKTGWYKSYYEYIVKASGPILTPMCGTGQFLLPILAEGFEIAGFDSDPLNLDLLHVKAKENHLRPTVWLSSLENPTIEKQYNLILITRSSFSFITKLEHALAFLTKIYEHLSDGGIFVFDTTKLAISIPTENIWCANVTEIENSKFIITNTLDLPLKNDIRTSLYKYELMNKNEIVRTEIEIASIRNYNIDTIMPLLKEAGFENIKMINTFDKTQTPNDESPNITYECIK